MGEDKKRDKRMNTAITFFAGSLTFVLMMGLKIPIKKLSRFLAKGQTVYEDEKDKDGNPVKMAVGPLI